MKKAQDRFNTGLTRKEKEILEIFRIRLDLAKIQSFSSEHFAMLGMEQYCRTPTNTLFAKAVINKVFKRTGRTWSTKESRHGASIGLYEFAI